MVTKQVELDSIWRELGTFGKYQVFQISLLLYNVIPACFTILTAVFTGYIPDHSCKQLPGHHNGTSNITYEYGECEIKTFTTASNNSSQLMEKDICTHGYRYSVPTYSTYTAEWDLVCSRSNLPALAQSLVLAGQGIGAFFLSHVADRFGRKTVQVISSVGLLVSTSVIAASPSIIMVLVLRLVAGTFQQGVICTETPLKIEMLPRERRSMINCLQQIFWACGIVFLALFGYIFREASWRYLQLALAAWSIISLAEWWLLDESVRWLLVNGRTKQARAVLRKAAKWNNKDFNKIDKILTEVLRESNVEAENKLEPQSDEKIISQGDVILMTDTNIKPISTYNGLVTSSLSNNATDQKDSLKNGDAKIFEPSDASVNAVVEENDQHVVRYSIIDILKDRKLRINTFILWYTWLTVAATYYGLTLVSGHLAGDRFVNFFLSGLIEIPGGFLQWYLCDRIGRKKSIIVFYGVTGSCLIIATGLLTKFADVEAIAITATGLTLVGKMNIAAAFSTMFLYTPEIYPTNYRNRGLGTASSLSRIGAMLSPFASDLALIALWIPAAIFGGMCLLVTVLVIKLPESKHFELPQYLQEIHKWSKEEGIKENDSSTSASTEKGQSLSEEANDEQY